MPIGNYTTEVRYYVVNYVLHDFTTFTDDTPAAGLAVLRP